MIKIPYKVEKRGDKFVVVNKDTGKVMGTHPTRAVAVKQMRALYVHVPDAKESSTIEEFKPPEAGDAPARVKGILKKVYNTCRSEWVKEHPDDKENKANKQKCAKIAWSAAKKATTPRENNLNFMAIIESKDLGEKDGDKWVTVKGVALTTGMSSNKVDYSIANLEENDGSMFNVLVGHRQDYDNPDHNVGEGDYSLDGNDLKYEMTIKNTTSHPGIVEQVMDDMVSVSVQGGYDNIELITEKGKLKRVIVEGLHIPILALVNKHVRGVEGASIESALAERIEMESKDIYEVNNMEEKDVFAKQIQEKDEQLVDSTKLVDDAEKKIVEKDKSLKESTDKLKKFEDAEKTRVAEKHDELVDKICEVNKDLKKEELMEKSDSELEIIERYETEKVDAATDNSGSGVVNAINESIEDAKGSDENILDLGLMERFGDLTMNEEAYNKFNQDVKKRVLGEE